MFVLLRHPDDEDPEATYTLDPHITIKGIKSILKIVNGLVEEYGIPSIIYSSPLTRCRESSYYIVKYLKDKYNIKIEIIITPHISRYFTSNEKKNPDIRDRSVKFNTPVNETWKDFKKRIRYFNHTHKYELKTKNIVVWCVTHYLVIREYSKIYKFPIPDKMPYMWHIGLY